LTQAPGVVRMVALGAPEGRLGGLPSGTELAVIEVLHSGRWVGGPEVEACEREVAAHFGRVFGVGVNSGSDAITLALQALGVGAGDEVLVPALTFFSTAGAVVRTGARPVVVDVREDQPLLDPASAAERAGSATKAVVPVHLFGMTASDPGLGLPVVEDAAQSAGRTPPIRLGVATVTSFYPTKTLHAAGDGGLVATDDPELALAVRRLANHGQVPAHPHLHDRVAGHVGWNSRLDAIQAAVVRRMIPEIASRVLARRQTAALYDTALGPSCRLVRRDASDPMHQYVLRCERRDELAAHLMKLGIQSAIYYPHTLSAQPALAPQPDAPHAEAWCAEVLSVPCHESLENEEVIRVAEALSGFRP
jgi:dTDP-4-amino-4,6-dideoxygalactose transaminase